MPGWFRSWSLLLRRQNSLHGSEPIILDNDLALRCDQAHSIDQLLRKLRIDLNSGDMVEVIAYCLQTNAD